MGEMDYGRKKITMADVVIKIIQENQLSSEEEDMILKIVGERKLERIKNKSCRCLADFAERERELGAADHVAKTNDRVYRLHRRFLRETRIGSMDVERLSDAELRRLIISAAESGEMKKMDWLNLLAMIQIAVKAAASEHSLECGVFKTVYFDCQKAEDKIRYGKNPYTPEEMQKITEWLDQNTDDIRALAVDMWLCGGITPEEIVRLRTGWLMDIDGPCAMNPTVIKKNEAEDYLPFTGRRSRIIQDALKIQEGSGNEYIFMINDDWGWKNMSEKCIQLKMAVICRFLDIRYRPFKWTDAIIC